MIWRAGNSREHGKSLAGLVSMLLLVLLAAGCESEDGASADGEGAPRSAAPPMQELELELAAGHGEPLKVQVPSEPVATAPSGEPGATLEVYALQRIGPESLTLVFGLALDEDADSEGIGISYEFDADGVRSYGDTDGVTLLDPVNLRRHLAYRDTEGDCMCSQQNTRIKPGERLAFAGIYPAPPEDVTEMAVQTPIGSIPVVPITDPTDGNDDDDGASENQTENENENENENA